MGNVAKNSNRKVFLFMIFLCTCLSIWVNTFFNRLQFYEHFLVKILLFLLKKLVKKAFTSFFFAIIEANKIQCTFRCNEAYALSFFWSPIMWVLIIAVVFSSFSFNARVIDSLNVHIKNGKSQKYTLIRK